MSFSFAEIAAHQKTVAVKAKAQHTQTLKEHVHAGQEMAALLDDPRFMLWTVEVLKMRDLALAQTRQREERLLASLLPQDEYIAVKLEQAAFRATAQAYDNALHVARRIVSEGEKAAEELKDGSER
jgi:hypothetical protein